MSKASCDPIMHHVIMRFSCVIVAGTIESDSSLQMPPELEDQPFICFIG